jgi:Nif-specific regulatory protein
MQASTSTVTESLSKKELTLFYDVATSIQAIRSLDDMLRDIFRQIKSVLDIEGASIALHDPRRKQFYFIRTVEKGLDGSHDGMSRMHFPDHLGIAGWVLKKGLSAVIPDVSKEKRFFKGIDLQENFKTRSMICLPLHARKGLIGVLYALNKTKGEFTNRDARLLQILSGTIAIAVENAKLYGELKKFAGSLAEENRRLRETMEERYNLQGIIGSSPAMQQIFMLLDKVMHTETSVLIEGETGTGKELIAKVIHFHGLLKDKAFIAENCAALSENLLESELFGHVKGAFTGATADKKGLFEMANGGTIFLDEIGEMPMTMQVKLLRVLQEGQLRPVGGTRYIDVKFRLIASTNRNLQQEVARQQFREDLYYRISVFPVTLPPLRKRKEDIPLLADHFLKKISQKLKIPPPQLAPEALDLLIQYNWPGNIREFQNEIERALTLAGDAPLITSQLLSAKIIPAGQPHLEISKTGTTMRAVTEKIEKQMISDTLRQTKGNRSEASRILGITRQGLLNKIARYHIHA